MKKESGRVRRREGKVPPMRKLDARRDTLDFRDLMFVPALVEVPVRIDLKRYLSTKVPVLDQGTEGACTGFGLATVANYLLRKRRVVPDRISVSPRMFYEIARRYDEWPGEDYSGSSARGAMKGWHKHGVCSHKIWPYSDDQRDEKLFPTRWQDAVRRPLGAYFRVNHKDLIAMHAALAEVGILYATSDVHTGWDSAGSDGLIRYSKDITGGHAFAIVAFEERGFWIQNSWGKNWGKAGLGLVSYDDWLANGTDVWVARLGAPVALLNADSASTGVGTSAKGTRSYVFCDLRPHIISIGDEGRFRTNGTYGTSEDDVRDIILRDAPRLMKTWSAPEGAPRKLLVYAHGGLVAEEAAIQRVADYRATLLDAKVYPLAFVWKTDYWSTITNLLQDALGQRRPEGFLDATKDFMLDRLDDALEPLARALTGKAVWDEIKKNALAASAPGSSAREPGAARVVASLLAELNRKMKVEIHLTAHSAGSILLAPLVDILTLPRRRGGLGLTIKTCTLWAPSCTVALFQRHYLPAIRTERIERFRLFTLTDAVEQDDNCADIYHKSLLYLISNAFESKLRMPGKPWGEPLLGLARVVTAELSSVTRLPNVDWIRSPNERTVGDAVASRATSHGSFDDDRATLQATLASILDATQAGEHPFEFQHSASGQQTLRRGLEQAAQV